MLIIYFESLMKLWESLSDAASPALSHSNFNSLGDKSPNNFQFNIFAPKEKKKQRTRSEQSFRVDQHTSTEDFHILRWEHSNPNLHHCVGFTFNPSLFEYDRASPDHFITMIAEIFRIFNCFAAIHQPSPLCQSIS